MTRERTGSAYEKHGVIVIAIRLRAGSRTKKWVSRCPARPDGVPVDLNHGRKVAGELQRLYDARTWDPDAGDAPPMDPALHGFAPPAPAATPRGVDSSSPGRAVIDFVRAWLKTQTYESAPKDRARAELYLAPSPLASMLLSELRPKHLLAHINWLKLRPSGRGGTLAPRTVRGAYDVLRRALDAAVIEELLPANPCAPIRGKLPSLRDKNPAARQHWLYSREDIVTLISDARVPDVRRVSYALQFLTGMRVGELAVLRWSDHDPNARPLGRVTIARAQKSVSKIEAETKTAAVKIVPIHPALAAILDEWRRTGWARYMNREPARDDLVVPNQFGCVRNTNRHNRDLGRDCRKLGIEHRHQHAMRHTFITLVQDDGADGSVIRWITHAPPRSAFDSYTRGQWQRLCAEIARLRIEVTCPRIQLALEPARPAADFLASAGTDGPVAPKPTIHGSRH